MHVDLYMAPDFLVCMFTLLEFPAAVLLPSSAGVVRLCLPEAGFPTMNHFPFTTPCTSPPPEQVSALLDEATGRLSHLRSSTPAGTSDASTWFEECNHSDDNTATKTLYDGPSPISISSAEGVGLTSGLEPTYMGHMPTVEEAHVLLEACLFGPKRVLPRGPRPDELLSLVRSGNVFLYEHHTSGIKHWDDRICWSPKYHDDGFWVSCRTTDANGLRKKTLSIPG